MDGVLATALIAEVAAAGKEVVAGLVNLFDGQGGNVTLVAATAVLATAATTLEVVVADLTRDVLRGRALAGGSGIAAVSEAALLAVLAGSIVTEIKALLGTTAGLGLALTGALLGHGASIVLAMAEAALLTVFALSSLELVALADYAGLAFDVLIHAVLTTAAAATHVVVACLLGLFLVERRFTLVKAAAVLAPVAAALQVIVADLSTDVTALVASTATTTTADFGAGIVVTMEETAVVAVVTLALVTEVEAFAARSASVALAAAGGSGASVVLAVAEATLVAVLAAALGELVTQPTRGRLDSLTLGVLELAVLAETAAAGVTEGAANFGHA